jgi:hypothetical protein
VRPRLTDRRRYQIEAPRERLDHRRHGSANQSLIRLSPRQGATRRSPRKAPWARIGPSAAAIEVSDGCQVSGHSRQTVGDLRLFLPCRDIREALPAGGTDHAAPGVREQYHPTYNGAFVLDPDDHNIEAVGHQAECPVGAGIAVVLRPGSEGQGLARSSPGGATAYYQFCNFRLGSSANR